MTKVKWQKKVHLKQVIDEACNDARRRWPSHHHLNLQKL